MPRLMLSVGQQWIIGFGKMTEKKKTPEQQWWEEEAKRQDKMAELARKKNKIIKTGNTKPPVLNSDGSEKK